ncbi:hypothetical protein [Herbaspirillum sp.]|uniref:hypothetical protein n=1 Tax=Herbaspirillum sp. TaxID=1890675 RepID=UPI000C0BA338|nr:hypothetical protein [Herbaspirillum sp.]MAF01291.1 hypothetical protein [Herbaspirillum sp.]
MNSTVSIADLTLFFGQAPSKVIPDEGTCIFVLSSSELKLTVAINEVVPSFMTSLVMKTGEEMRMEFDGLQELALLTDNIGPYLLASLDVQGRVQCRVRVIPGFSVCWSYLR